MNDSKKDINFTAIGEKVKNRRVSLGLSQEQLAELCGITASYIGHIERGSRKLSLNTAISLSEALNISLDYLLLDIKGTGSSVLEAISADLVNNDKAQAEKFLNLVSILAEKIDEL